MAPQEVFQGIISLDSFQSEVNSLYLQNLMYLKYYEST